VLLISGKLLRKLVDGWKFEIYCSAQTPSRSMSPVNWQGLLFPASRYKRSIRTSLCLLPLLPWSYLNVVLFELLFSPSSENRPCTNVVGPACWRQHYPDGVWDRRRVQTPGRSINLFTSTSSKTSALLIRWVATCCEIL
jgi:hypothetical protein